MLGYVHHVIKQNHDKKLASGETTIPWKRWIVPSWFHVLLGPTVIIIAHLTIVQGFQLFYFNHYPNLFTNDPPPAIIRFGYAAIIILGITFVSFYTLGKLTAPVPGAPAAATNSDENKNAREDA